MITLKQINEEFDEEFPEDIYCSAHSNWLPKNISDFWNSKIKQILEELKKEKISDIQKSYLNTEIMHGYNKRTYDLNQKIQTFLEEK